MKELNKIVEVFVKESHEILKDNNTAGICYLLSHCLNEYLLELGYDSKKVTGKLALLKKGNNTKYVTYGKFNLKNYELKGYYHSWCSVYLKGKVYTIDTSLGYNKSYFKKNGVAISSSIPNSLVTLQPNTYHYKYLLDESLNYMSENTLNSVPKVLLDKIINNCLNKYYQSLK